MSLSSVIQQILSNELKSCGFRKEKSLYIRERGSVWDIARIQRSRFGDEYFLRCGFFLPEVEQNSVPILDNYHADLMPQFNDECKSWECALTVQSNMAYEDRVKIIHSVLTKNVVPAYEEFHFLEDFAREELRINAVGVKPNIEQFGRFLVITNVLRNTMIGRGLL